MLLSLALIFLLGLAMASICQRLKLPRIIGMLLMGIVLGPYVLQLLDPSILGISSELRKIALIIILIKAGLSLDLKDLKRVGRPAVLMAFLPACLEIAAFVLFAPTVLGINRTEAALIGAVLGAVSPAVVVPKMVELMEKHYGTEKGVPQMILAGASLDDVFVIVLFSTFISMAQGGNAGLTNMLNVPVSIVLGILLGIAAGYVLAWYFESAHHRGHSIRNSAKVLMTLGTAFLLECAETWLEGKIAVSGLLAVMSMACMMKLRCRKAIAADLTSKFGKLWVAA